LAVSKHHRTRCKKTQIFEKLLYKREHADITKRVQEFEGEIVEVHD